MNVKQYLLAKNRKKYEDNTAEIIIQVQSYQRILYSRIQQYA